VKPVVAAVVSPTSAAPTRQRPVTAGFATQLSLAAAPTPANPHAAPRGLVGIASRAQAAKQSAAQPQPQLPMMPPQLPQLDIVPSIQPLPAALPIAVDAPAPAPATPAPVRAQPGNAPAPPPTITDAPVAIAAVDPGPAPPVRTPLEQAVHDLLSQIDDDTKHAPPSSEAAAQAAAESRLAQTAPAAPIVAPAPVHAAAPAAPIAQPEPQAMQSAHHAHIVLGDDANRVVMTVAVRGANVNVTLKTADEHTAAALARNAGSLDEAMRHRGLELDSFEAGHEAGGQPRDRQHHQHEPKRREPESTEPFELEESV